MARQPPQAAPQAGSPIAAEAGGGLPAALAPGGAPHTDPAALRPPHLRGAPRPVAPARRPAPPPARPPPCAPPAGSGAGRTVALLRPPRRSAPCRAGGPLPPRGGRGAPGGMPLLPLTSAVQHVSSPVMMRPSKLSPSASYWFNRSWQTHTRCSFCSRVSIRGTHLATVPHRHHHSQRTGADAQLLTQLPGRHLPIHADECWRTQGAPPPLCSPRAGSGRPLALPSAPLSGAGRRLPLCSSPPAAGSRRPVAVAAKAAAHHGHIIAGAARPPSGRFRACSVAAALT